jgi:hypothetical protein
MSLSGRMAEEFGPAVEQYVAFAGKLGASIVDWADPKGLMASSPTRVSVLGHGSRRQVAGRRRALKAMAHVWGTASRICRALSLTANGSLRRWCCPQTWPLADFPTALAIAIGYLTFVIVGSVSMPALLV